MQRAKLVEIHGELKSIFSGNRNLIDSILPPLIFVLINETIGFDAAMLSALIVALGFAVFRVIRRHSLLSALGGIAGVVGAILLFYWSGKDEGFFLPGIISNQVWVLAILVSLIIGKPLIALGSYFLRRWPLDWYWHPRVRPAYMEVSLIWLVFLGVRSVMQISFYLNQAVDELAILTLITGTPMTIVLLVVSYLYGNWRLMKMKGPSVIEYQEGISYPWRGQGQGF